MNESSTKELATRQNTQPVHTIQEIAQMSHAIARSGLFGIQNEQQAMALLLIAQANGLHPMKAVERYHIIDGKPSKKADAMLSDFLQSGGKFRWLEYSETACEAEFSHSGNTVRIRWTIEMAQAAGLTKPRRSGKASPWQIYPRQMLKARVISEGIRATYPGASDGLYTPEEVRQFDDPVEPAKDVTPKTPEVIPPRKSAKESYSSRALAKLKERVGKCKTIETLLDITAGLTSIRDKMTEEAYQEANRILDAKRIEIENTPSSGIKGAAWSNQQEVA